MSQTHSRESIFLAFVSDIIIGVIWYNCTVTKPPLSPIFYILYNISIFIALCDWVYYIYVNRPNRKIYNESTANSQSLPMVLMDGLATMPAVPGGNGSNSLNDFDSMFDSTALSIIDCHTMGSNALHDGVKAIKSFKAEKRKLLCDESSPHIDSLRSLFEQTSILHAILINVTLMLMLITWNAMVPLLLAQSLHLDSLAIGMYSAYNGVVLFLFTWYIQPVLLKKFELKSLYIGCGIAMLVVVVGLPSVTLIPNILSWNVIFVVMLTSFIGAFKFAFSTNLFVVSLVFVNNCVPPQAMGRANGLAQALGAGLRGIGPLIGGVLWSWSVTLDNMFAVYIAYGFMWIPTAYSILHCYCFIHGDIQKTWTERYKK